ncbi:MAG: hypothetical protein IV086_17985 [Hyphomonadaceae bacterium]|nr:hypothetical protein [Hyphomonadaceae bacterium]
MVCNRLVDFALAAPEHAPIRSACLNGAVVLTPNPHTHALFADKRSLTLLSNEAPLRSWGLSGTRLQALACLPNAMRVNEAHAATLWAAPKRHFLKPTSGYGGKAAYRGDKLTKSVWDAILAGEYTPRSSRRRANAPFCRTGNARDVNSPCALTPLAARSCSQRAALSGSDDKFQNARREL